MPDPAHDEDAVRRLLAEARRDEPLPPEVAARLDTLLGQLVEARTHTGDPGVTSLDERRHRRRGLLLLAAAAAVVTGVVVPTVGRLGTGDDQATSAGSRAADSSAADSSAEQDAGSTTGRADESDSSSELGAPVAPPPAADGVVALTRTGFLAQVRRAEDSRSLAQPPATQTCAADPGVDYGRGTLVAATYDGTPAVLAYRPPGGLGQRVEVLACGSATVIRTTLLPAS